MDEWGARPPARWKYFTYGRCSKCSILQVWLGGWDVSSSSTNIIGFYPARVWGWMDGWMNGYALFGSGLSLSFGLGWELSAGGIDRDPVGMTVNPIPIILLLLLSTE